MVRNWAEFSMPYGTAIRNIGAWRWMYRPFCRRSGRNSSSVSSPAFQRRTWSRNWATRSSINWRSMASYLYIGFSWGKSGEDQLAADQHQHGGQDAAQDVLRHLGGKMAADPDAGQRAEQQ